VIRFDSSLEDPPFEGGASSEAADATSPAEQPRIALDPENVADGLGKLVLTLVEVIRQVLEKQALRRIEAGSLTDVEIERLGVTFLRLSEEMKRLQTHFGLEDEDLNLDLGPLGKLL
jgi:Gas vesicle protein K